MRDPAGKGVIAFFVLAASLLAAAPGFPGEDAAHGWRRSGGGFWGDAPEVHAGFSDNGIALEMTLPPGKEVTYSRDGKWAAESAIVEMSTDTIRQAGNEYFPGEVYFPASVTFVYGKDALPFSWYKRLKLFYTQMRKGFRPSGIRLTYAWGNRVPVGSMYRLWEEETVFVLAGIEEAEKKITSARKLSDDFKAAYGRPPKGPVTRVLVEACRPSVAKGPAHTSITVRFPAD